MSRIVFKKSQRYKLHQSKNFPSGQILFHCVMCWRYESNDTEPIGVASVVCLLLEAGIAYRITLCQNCRFFMFPALSGFEPKTPLQLTRQSCHRLCKSDGVLPAPIGPPFVRKDRNNEITIHVPSARVQGRHRRLSKQIEPTYTNLYTTHSEPIDSVTTKCGNYSTQSH